MKSKVNWLLLLVMVSVVSACVKDKQKLPEPIEKETPSIVINAPTEEHYDIGDSLIVNVLATDAKEMHDLKAWLITIPENDTIWYKRVHSHKKEVVLEGGYLLEGLPNNQQVQLSIYAENANGKSADTKLLITVHEH